MTLPLRKRIVLTLFPLLALLLIPGTAGVWLLYHLGTRSDAILRENYDSVIAMERLSESLKRIDSSFQFTLAGQEAKARTQYEANWKTYRDNLRLEQGNITLPGEKELVGELTALTERYANSKGQTSMYALAAIHAATQTTLPTAASLKRLRKSNRSRDKLPESIGTTWKKPATTHIGPLCVRSLASRLAWCLASLWGLLAFGTFSTLGRLHFLPAEAEREERRLENVRHVEAGSGGLRIGENAPRLRYLWYA